MTIPFSIYDLSTGKILRTGYADEVSVKQQHQQGEGVFYRELHTDKHRVVNGQVIDLPSKPTQFHVYDYKSSQWSLNENAAWVSVKETRTRLLNETDWMIVRAQETGSGLSTGLLAYRQALRDITLQDDPLNIKWPVLNMQ